MSCWTWATVSVHHSLALTTAPHLLVRLSPPQSRSRPPRVGLPAAAAPAGGGAALEVLAALGRIELRMDLMDAEAGSLMSPHSHNPAYEHLAYQYIIANMPRLCGLTVQGKIPIQRFQGDLSDFEWDARVFLDSVPRSTAGTLTLLNPDGRDFIVYGGHALFIRPPVVGKRTLSPFRSRSSGLRVAAEYVGIFEVTRVYDWTRQSGGRGPLLPRLELRLGVSLERAIAVAAEVGSPVPSSILDVVGVISVCGVNDSVASVSGSLSSVAGRGEFPLLSLLFEAGRFIFIRVPERELPSRLAPPGASDVVPETAELDTSGTLGDAAAGGDAEGSRSSNASAAGGHHAAAGSSGGHRRRKRGGRKHKKGAVATTLTGKR